MHRDDVLAVLKSADAPQSVLDIADSFGVHPNTVRFHLHQLVGEGRIEQVAAEPTGTGRPPLLFRVVRGMDPGGPRHYRELAETLGRALAAAPDPATLAVAAGRDWGAQAESPSGADHDAHLEHLVALLDDLGFAPEVSAGATAIQLRHCPFLEVAEQEPGVVCAVHLGLMRGVLEARNAPLAVESLEPFAEPDRCVAHLAATGAGP